MFQFPGLPSHRLCIYLWILKHYLKCVPAFGNLRIIGYLLLPAAYRSLSRPSSAPSAKASALCSSSLDLLLVFCPLRCVAARILRYSHTWVCSVPRCSRALRIKQNPAQIFLPTPALCVGFLYYCLLVVKIFWFSRFNIEIVTHKILKKHSCDLSRFRFFSLLTCLYTIWYFIQFSRYIITLSYHADSSHKCSPAHYSRQWWAWEDSNLRPHAYQACALTTWATSPYKLIVQKLKSP